MTRIVPRSDLPKTLANEPASRLAAGVRLGRYELLCPIAEGGMAQVWAAEQTGDLGFRKLIAVKTIRPDFAYDASFRAMFLDEAQLASRIRHGNVVEVLDLGVDGDIVYQAMALVDGAAASEWLRNVDGHPSVGAAVRIAIDVLHGLHAAHTLKDDEGHPLGLVHRDVSPQNVLIGSDGVAKLADFGIAKAFGRATEETVAGDVKGKLGYVAPEQLSGLPAAPQSDLFSAGVVFWELLTGQRLFPIRQNTSDERRAMSMRDPRSVSPEIPGAIAEIVMRSLHDDPFERYETSLEMADALEEAVRRAGIVASHRNVAMELERDLGRRMGAQRERLRQARKRAGIQVTPTPRPRGRLHVEETQPPRPPPSSPPASIPISIQMHTAPLALPATRVFERQDFATDTVTVAEAGASEFHYPSRSRPTVHRPRSSSSTALPLVLAGLLLVVLVTAIALWGTPRRPPQLATQPPAPTPIALTPSPFPPAAPLPIEVQPRSVIPAPITAPLPSPVVMEDPAPSATVHRPPLPRGRTRQVTAPRSSPAPQPAPATPTVAPRFENPY